MCCDLPKSILAPAPVAEMLAEYRRLQATSLLDWGHEVGDIPGDEFSPFLDLNRLWISARETGDWSEAIRRVPAGPAASWAARGSRRSLWCRGELWPAPASRAGEIKRGRCLDRFPFEPGSQPGRGRPTVPSRCTSVSLVTASVDHESATLQIGDNAVVVGEKVLGARLRLRADAISRWSVVDERGQGWFPDERLHKWDYHGRPFFHGNDLVLEVPARPLEISCTRGMEFTTVTKSIVPAADEEAVVVLEPEPPLQRRRQRLVRS